MSDAQVFGKYEKYLLPTLPLVGIALVAILQMGRYSFYDVPFDLLEIDTIKTLISGMTLGSLTVAGVYAALLLHQGEKHPVARYVEHLTIVTVITSPYWAPTIDLGAKLSVGTILFVVIASAITFAINSFVLRLRSERPEQRMTKDRIASAALLVFFSAVLLAVSAYIVGYHGAKDQKRHMFLAGTNLLVVGRLDGKLVIKEYRPSSRTLHPTKTILLDPPSEQALEERAVAIVKTE